MSLRRNIVAGYAGQIYVTVIGIVMVPMYVKYMGVEAYGLVGFFVMLQAWFQLLDLGLTPTLSREASRCRGGATSALNFRRLLRILETIFVVVACLGAIVIISMAGSIAEYWLKVQHLSQVEVQYAIVLMALIIALRWISSLYRGAVSGFELLVWLNGFNGVVASIRFVLVIPFFIFVGTSPIQFFSYQLTIAICELVVLVVQTYRFLPKSETNGQSSLQCQPLHKVFKFSLSIAFTSTVWVLVTQTDKLILSKLLLLSDYAYFTLAVLVASGVLAISTPISGALMPRMARLNAEGDDIGLIKLYRSATQMVGIVAAPATLVLVFFPEQVLWIWTGDTAVASKAAAVLSFYASGNGLLVLAAFPYYLQFAKGDLKLHMIGNALFVVIYIPLLTLAADKYGMVGAGYAWVVANLLPFTLWLPIVHKRFVKGLHTKWMMVDILPIVLPPTVLALALQAVLTWSTSRSIAALVLIIIGLSLCVVASAGSSWVRDLIIEKWHIRFYK